MTVPTVGANFEASMIQGIYRDLENTWADVFPVFDRLISAKAYRIPYKGTRVNKFAFKGSFGRPEIWDHSRGRQHQSVEDYSVDISMLPFEQTIDLMARDRKHDQLSDPRAYISNVTKRFLQLPQRRMLDYQEGTLTANRVLHKAFDGADLYSATDGDGNARFGSSGGNIQTGFVRTEQGFYQALLDSQQVFMAFKDTKKEDIIYSHDDVSFDKMLVEVPRTMADLVQQVADVSLLRLNTGNNVSEGNLFTTSSKYKFEFFVNNLLTNQNNFYIHLKHPLWKSHAIIQEDSVETFWTDMKNSDRAREYGAEGLYCNQETAIGVWAPWVTIKVTP